MRNVNRIEPGPDQESVWDYPRPPRLEPAREHVVVVFNGIAIADSVQVYRVLETSHPPNYYIPVEDIRMDYLSRNRDSSACEWKGRAHYFDLVDGRVRSRNAAWGYRRPTGDFEPLRDHVAFYAGRVDACYVDDEKVTPQPGDFYGGWITSRVVGPFKGVPGSLFW
jgi:uncharacterized protein (DUF427 family)